MKIIPIQAMNSEIRMKYEQYVEKYRNTSPQINRLKSALNQIQDDEFFFTSNRSTFSTEEILFIDNLLHTYNASMDDKERAEIFQEQIDRQDEAMGDFFSKYTVLVFDSEKRKSIGEQDRQKRICRFCKNGMHTEVKVTFNKKAHAFSEALGNKSVILNEECDGCNEKFGITIEEDFIAYLDIYRVFYQVQGKNGIPKLKYKNGGMVTSIDGKIKIQSQNIEHDEETGNTSILLESHQTIKSVNIYKTLCKYILSTINEETLAYLQNTIQWITSKETEYIQLPKVGRMMNHKMFAETPMLAIYIRKDDDSTYPHIVGEFKFKSLIFVFIVPFSEKDEVNFTDKKEYEVFWSTFKHYSAVPTWSFQDFSFIEAKKLQFNINFQQGKEKSH
ncbi:MAG: hypothetical protein WC667_04915 [Sulfurimonas sp.]|jgi:hypothetical protein